MEATSWTMRCLFIAFLAATASGVSLKKLQQREVGGQITRHFPHDIIEADAEEGQMDDPTRGQKREVGGLISRKFPHETMTEADDNSRIRDPRGYISNNRPLKRHTEIEEVWTVVGTEDENMIMDSRRGKIPLSATEDFRGLIPILP